MRPRAIGAPIAVGAVSMPQRLVRFVGASCVRWTDLAGLDGLFSPALDPHRRTDAVGIATVGAPEVESTTPWPSGVPLPGRPSRRGAAVVLRLDSDKVMGTHPDVAFGMESMIKSHMRDAGARQDKAFALLQLGHQTIAIRGHGPIP